MKSGEGWRTIDHDKDSQRPGRTAFKSICFAKLLSEKTDSADKQANLISKSSQTDIKPALVNYTVWRGPTISYDGMNTNLKANNNKKPTYCDK